ncbi:MAG: ImmA/IrrE family metallo-endopeptidase [Betaproteobacteria bacterium AqS2]|uniref:ImmA/IrrE family metallo-endopeptidase n=1 Tax=Candidatus Amphirhobacter heronislandensis TaxID=1732024 RepID=A0A930UGV7_9GAMM|nr:ImmA/IrrE family metallo-endopeptidase [Betaproteobacteria bacterium AqS2]
MSREIFTLAHELGHYLLNREDVDRHGFEKEIRSEEGWCNEFAFHFVLGKDGIKRLDQITGAKKTGMFEEILKFAKDRHVSLRAISRHLSAKGGAKASISREVDQAIRNGLAFKPNSISRSGRIISPLETDIFLDAWDEGLVGEVELDDRFGDAWVTANIYQGGWENPAFNA